MVADAATSPNLIFAIVCKRVCRRRAAPFQSPWRLCEPFRLAYPTRAVPGGSRGGLSLIYMSKPLPPASDDLLNRYGAVLGDLGAAHGLSRLRHAAPGVVVADVEDGRTLSDVARFELEAESLLGAALAVIASDAPAAARLASAPLQATSAARATPKNRGRRDRLGPGGPVPDSEHDE